MNADERKALKEKIKAEIKADPLARLLSWLVMLKVRKVRDQIDPRRFNGASLLGLKGIVVKSHGHADELAFGYALQHTQNMLSVDLVRQLDDQFKLVRSYE